MKKSLLLATAVIGGAMFFASCDKEDETPAPAAQPSIYERLGGTNMVTDPTSSTNAKIEQGRLALRSVVDSSILVIAADTSMTKFFPVLFSELGNGNTSGLTALSKNFTDFLAVATGAKNYTYTGKNMKDAHDPAKNNRMGEKSSEADFNRFMGDLSVGLAQNGVVDAGATKELRTDIVNLLLTTKADIVQK